MFDSLVSSIKSEAAKHSKSPFIIAVSGFGGSGKSTLAHQLQQVLTQAEVISIDAFVVNHLSSRSEDWSDFDRNRFLTEVLIPAQKGKSFTYGIYSWQADTVNEYQTVPETTFLIVEGCSLLHPLLLSYYNYSVWIDLPLEEATRRGIVRDRAQGTSWDEKWLEIWMPNERDFLAKYNPVSSATFIYKAGDLPT